MVRVLECPDCGCIMKCTEWYFDSNAVGGEPGEGEFDCRNCDYLANNESDDVFLLEGYTSAVLGNVPADKQFSEFIDENEDLIVYERE